MPTLITLKAAVWQKEGFNVKEVQPSWTFQVHIVQFTLCSAYALLYMFLYMMSTCFLCFLLMSPMSPMSPMFIIQHRPYRLLNRAKQLFEDLNELPSEVIHGA